jgi:hypothetical protein
VFYGVAAGAAHADDGDGDFLGMGRLVAIWFSFSVHGDARVGKGISNDFISLTPGFRPVLRASEKPLKRLVCRAVVVTGLKPGVNERS